MSRSDRTFALLVTLAYVPVALFAIGHHEMWRDELHCWLVARDSATPWAVIHNRAYDGQQPLWYLLLWVLEKATHDPLSMQVVHVAIAVAVVWTFASRAPFERPLRALFPFGYFLAYEYVALSRCYGLALLFALWICVNHPRRFTRPVATALLLAGLALTTTVATLVSAAYAAALIFECLAIAQRGGRVPRTAWIPIVSMLTTGVAAALCAWPPADSTVAHVTWPRELPSDDAPTRLIVAMLPVPRVDFFFWNSNLFLSYEPFRRVALGVSAVMAAWIVFVVSRDRAAAVLFGVGSALLVLLFACVYGGDVRHHGFLFVLFLMAAWMSKLRDPAHLEAGATGPVPSRWARARDAALTPTLAVVLIAHVAGTPVALYYDYKYVFSSGRRAADALRARGLEKALLVAEIDFPATAVIGALGPTAVAFSPRNGRPFSFVKWTADRHWDPTDDQTLRYAATLGATRGEDAVLLMNRPLRPELVDGRAVTRIAELYDSMIEEENFYIYRVASGAVSRR